MPNKGFLAFFAPSPGSAAATSAASAPFFLPNNGFLSFLVREGFFLFAGFSSFLGLPAFTRLALGGFFLPEARFDFTGFSLPASSRPALGGLGPFFASSLPMASPLSGEGASEPASGSPSAELLFFFFLKISAIIYSCSHNGPTDLTDLREFFDSISVFSSIRLIINSMLSGGCP
ncbi:MAG: hypothetical protein ACYC5A_00205 [Thermoleophilia bacterium]